MGGSYPAGCNSVPGDEIEYCRVCGMADDCCCPECPVCGQQGNPKCYSEGNPEDVKRYAELLKKLNEELMFAIDSRDTAEIERELKELDKRITGHNLHITEAQIASIVDAEDKLDNDYLQWIAEREWEQEQQESLDRYYMELEEHGRQMLETV